VVADLYSDDAANQVRILYGGSMKPHNAEELLEQPDVDGGLIGGASLKADSFTDIIDIAEKIDK
jgi:triosephosphate isomerase